MITFEGYGDILESNSQTITCTINTVGVMGKGLALDFKRKIPGLFPFYRSQYSKGFGSDFQDANRLAVFNKGHFKQVLLFPTKIDWRNNSILELVEANLALLSQTYESLNITSLAIPPLGCGLGNLDYQKDVRGLIYKYLDNIELPVEILYQ